MLLKKKQKAKKYHYIKDGRNDQKGFKTVLGSIRVPLEVGTQRNIVKEKNNKNNALVH